jgi:hypothetical protein
MKISSSSYNSQSVVSLLQDTQLSKSIEGDLQQVGSLSSRSSTSMGASYSQGYADLQSKLAASSLSDSSSGRSSSAAVFDGSVLRNAAGQTLNDFVGKVVGPADWLTQSDIDLFHAATGGTIKNGVIYDKNGDVSDSDSDGALVNALFDMRNYGTFDSSDQNLVKINGSAITADDIKNYIQHYQRSGSSVDIGYDVLDKAVNVLSSPQSSAGNATA